MLKTTKTINRIFLGLLMLVAGLSKLLVFTPDGVSKMLSGIVLFAWAPMFWAWILILSEILFGLAIIANFKLNYTVIPPIIILVVAVLTSTIKWEAITTTSWNSLFFHLIAIANLIIIGFEYKKR